MAENEQIPIYFPIKRRQSPDMARTKKRLKNGTVRDVVRMSAAKTTAPIVKVTDYLTATLVREDSFAARSFAFLSRKLYLASADLIS